LSLSTRAWTALTLNFARADACAAQQSGIDQVWIYGGDNLAGSTATFLTFDGKNWTSTPAVVGALPIPARSGTSAAFYGTPSIVTFGGMCGTTFYSDIYRYNIAAKTWAKDASTLLPLGLERAQAAVFIQQDTLFVFGGLTSLGASSAAYSYDLKNFNWTILSTASLPAARYASAIVPLTNRAILFAGASSDTNSVYADAWQFVSENQCLGKSCEDCTSPSTTGCGWCSGNSAGFQCVAGASDASYVASSCSPANGTYTTDTLNCPEPFPSWAIALIVIGAVVLIGIVIFAIMKVRAKNDYTEISG